MLLVIFFDVAVASSFSPRRHTSRMIDCLELLSHSANMYFAFLHVCGFLAVVRSYRKLSGCYSDLDEFMSKYRSLLFPAQSSS